MQPGKGYATVRNIDITELCLPAKADWWAGSHIACVSLRLAPALACN